jgi:pimeloyl-ACP methyl ester carboxylesterase
MAPVGTATTHAATDEGPVRTEELAVPDDLAAFVVRGGRSHGTKMVFVPGMCVHPAGYVMAFQHTAAGHGDLLAVQGDVSCGGDGTARAWSNDLSSMDRRITAAFEAAGFGAPQGAVIIGYSQGAERAEQLVARWPERYSRVVLMASPIAPSPKRLAKAKAVVTMAGTFDISRARMKAAVGPLTRAEVPALFVELPNARHGGMGDEPEVSMDRALEFLRTSSR